MIDTTQPGACRSRRYYVPRPSHSLDHRKQLEVLRDHLAWNINRLVAVYDDLCSELRGEGALADAVSTRDALADMWKKSEDGVLLGSGVVLSKEQYAAYVAIGTDQPA